MAQATISGTVAFGVDEVNKATQYGFQTTNINFRATEDLGGGMSATAAVRIETGTNANRGNVAGAAGAAVSANSNIYAADRSLSLAGGFGTVSFASTRSTNAAVGANVAPLSLNIDQYGIEHGVFSPVARTGITSLSYVSPQLAPGLRVNVARVMKGTSEADQGSGTNVFGATYAAGPLTAAISVKQNNDAAKADIAAALTAYGVTTAASAVKGTTTELNATYNFGVAVVGAGWSSKMTDTGKAAMTFGVRAPVASNITVGLNYGKRDKAKYQEIGAIYALSKRTSVELASGQYQKQTDTSSKTQYRLRLAHNF